MSRGWNAFRDCPHEGFCLTKKECQKREKRGETTRDGALKIVSHSLSEREIRASWDDPEFSDD